MKIIDVAAPSVWEEGDISSWIMIGMAALFVIILFVVFLIKKRKKRKKVSYLVLLFILLCSVKNVLADAGGPIVLSYDVVVTNNNGAACYKVDSKGKYVKTGKAIAKGKTFTIYYEITDGYIEYFQDGCDYISAKDVKTKKDKLDINNDEIEKITPKKAVVLAKGGLNLRKGSGVPYGRITTIPQYSVVTLSRRAGTYWYYAEYNGKKGWISGINGYFAYDTDYILLSYRDTPIYNSYNLDKKIGNIPALTEITDYIEFDAGYEDVKYYVNYNGIKGFINAIPFKTKGQINILKDTKVYDGKKEIGTIKAGEIIDYDTVAFDSIEAEGDFYFIFHIPSMKGIVKFLSENENKEFKYVKEGEPIKKTKGFIGEGLYGEKKTIGNSELKTTPEPIDEPIQNPNNEKTPKEKNNELIIICVLGSIILALTIVIILLLINRKKSKKESVAVKEIVVNNDNKILETKEEKVNEEKGEENEKIENE